MSAKPEQLFEYLLAIKNLTTPSVKSINKYDKNFFLNEFNELEGLGVKINKEFVVGEPWVEITKQVFLEVPEVPIAIKGWIDFDILNENDSPKYRKHISGNEREIFYNHFDLVEEFKEWIENVWIPWSEETKKRKKIQELYGYFYSLKSELERDSDLIELVFGHAFLTWELENEKINHPILLTKAYIDFDLEKGVINIFAEENSTRLQMDILTDVDIPYPEEIRKLKNELIETNFFEKSPDERYHFYNNIVNYLHSFGTYLNSSDIKINKNPVIYNAPILILRRKTGEVLKNDLTSTIEALENKQIQPSKLINSLLSEKELKIERNSEQSEEWKGLAEDLYFPLPANESQKEIVRKLEKSNGLTVQGPPGTGKSHTIANLISHLLSQGKRILVTSQKGHALKVLKDKIPEEIRSLCVPLLGFGTKSNAEIENSIRSISENMGYDSEQLTKEIERNKSELKSIRKEIQELEDDLKNIARSENETITWRGKEIKPIDIAKLLSENETDFEWLKDEIQLNQNPPLTDFELNDLYSLNSEFNKIDLKTIDGNLPKFDNSILNTYKELLETIKEKEGKWNEAKIILDCNNLTKLERTVFEKINLLCSKIINNQIFNLDDYDMWKKIMIAFETPDLKSNWEEFKNEINSMIKELEVKNHRVSEYEFSLPEKELYELEEDLKFIKERLETGKKIDGLFTKFGKGKKIKYLLYERILNGKPLHNLEDVNVLLEYIILLKEKQKILNKFNNKLSIYGKSLNKEIPTDSLSSEVRSFINFFEETTLLFFDLEEISLLIKDNNINNNFKDKYDKNQYTSLNEIMENYVIFQESISSKEKMDLIKHSISKQYNSTSEKNTIETEEIWDLLTESLKKDDLEKVENMYFELKRLQEVKSNFDKYEKLLFALSESAPKWAIDIHNNMGIYLSPPVNWKDCWELKKLDSYLNKLQQNKPEEIRKTIEEKNKQQRKIIETIVAKSTWKHQLQRITREQEKALQEWKTAIKKVGKGTGKYTDEYLKQAREAMKKCQGAIPVWIMPIEKVLENFSILNEQFDVAIIDESSQSSIEALPILMRAKKVVIVGDDQQISPSAVGINKEVVNNLINKHLSNIPSKNFYEMNTSLFEISGLMFPNSSKVLLREHFRCVPEIIQYSNDLSYGGAMIPLRIPNKEEMFEKPVLAKFVPGFRHELKKVNEIEAEKIVEDIKFMLEDEKYKNQTIGVISLLGKEQATLIENLLRNTIGEKTMEERQILCGDAYTFQGDERDVILLSMVIANNVGFNAQTKEDIKQRYNVAASRARNQMILYHSVRLEDLSVNDLRYGLLSYFINPHRITNKVKVLEEVCDSQFEIDVAKMIIAKGYSVEPQVEAGRYRIDLVVQGLRNRLAVECDGDQWHGIDVWEEDAKRQQELERVGWEFWRVRGSDFYRDRIKAMEGLWTKLEEMKIEKNI